MRGLTVLVSLSAALGCGADEPTWAQADSPAPELPSSNDQPNDEPDADPARADQDDEEGDGDGDGGSSTPDDGPKPDAGDDPVAPEPGFVEVTAQVGLDVDSGGIGVAPFCLLDNAAKPEEPGDFCHPEHFLGAVAVGDVDDDGWPDLYVTRRGGPDRMLRNEGGTFVDVTGAWGLNHGHTIGAAAWADVDNDGDLDLVLTGFADHRHYLMINNGSGHFSEQGALRGVALLSDAILVGMGIGVGDFDLDGWLDLFVAEWRPDKELGDAADRNRLLRGLGAAAPGHFHDVTDTTPLQLPRLAPQVDAKAGVYGFAPAFADLDDDGWPELTLTADFGTSRLLWNDAGRFLDSTWESGVGTERNGMGSTFGDFDGDGDIDWFVSAIWTDDFPWLGHRLYRNDGNRQFVDVAPEFEVHDAGWGWGTAWLDFDLDGDLDLAMAAGWPGLGYNEDRLRLWENTGAQPWPERSAALGVDVAGDGRGLVPVDYDRDGDLDLLVIGNEGSPRLFRNDVASGSWLAVRAVGSASNRQGIGAKVTVTAPGMPPQVRWIRGDSALMGQPAAEARFGFGDWLGPVDVEVWFPASDSTHHLANVSTGQRLDIGE